MKSGMPWTKQEIKVLRRFFGSNSNASLADMLDRTPKSVERKAAKLGLKKSKKYMRSLGKM